MERFADSRSADTLPAALQGVLAPAAYPHPVERVELVTTHMSWVLLTGKYAYKIKRPVTFAFADFSDPAHRAALCAEEIRLNRRFAPTLYLDVVPVRLAHGLASFVGSGPVIETAVRMRQFDRRDELDARVLAGTVGSAEFAQFGSTLAAIHANLPRPPATTSPSASQPGSPSSVAHLLRRNFAELKRLCVTRATPTPLRELRHALARQLRATRGARAARLAAGTIRECHGDLHLSNMVLLDGRITAFDALEFEPAFRYIDVADEVAFTCADLAGYGAPALAHAFLGGYLEASGDHRLLEVLDLYVAHRALVRAKIIAIRAGTGAGAPQLDAYLAVAASALRTPQQRPRPRLVLLHGLSGSGKTWLARQLAPRLQAIHLRSDVERKRLAGLAPLASSGSEPGAGLYAPDIGQHTYEHLAAIARIALRSGRSVICDATFLTRAGRAALRSAGSKCGATTTLVHCSAPEAELRRRLRARSDAGNDASEADEAVLDWQLRHAEPQQADEGFQLLAIDTTAADPFGASLRGLGEG